MIPEMVQELKDAANLPDHLPYQLRHVYDCAVDYFYEMGCFYNMYSNKPCMFESYGTVIDLNLLKKAICIFNDYELRVLKKAFETIQFTPLAGLVATVIGDYDDAS